MVALVIVCLAVVTIPALMYLHARYDYEQFIKKMAEEKTFEEIDEEIRKDTEIISNSRLKGQMYEDAADHKDMWEEIRRRKGKSNPNDEIALP